MMKRKSNFTLIELIVVIVVLGILAAIVLPNIQSFRKKANKTAKVADLRNIQTAVDMYRSEAEDLDGIGFADTDGDDTNAITGKVVLIENDKDGNPLTTAKKFALVQVSELEGEHLRKIPAYLKADFTGLNVGKGEVVLAVELAKDSKVTATTTPADVTLTSDDISGKVAFIQADKVVLD